jgi:hypothetical protein
VLFFIRMCACCSHAASYRGIALRLYDSYSCPGTSCHSLCTCTHVDLQDPKRLFEGNALLRRLVRIGVLDEDKMKLDYVLALQPEDFFERRLQTQVFKLGLAKSVHHARVLIRQRHVRVRKQLVNIPSFLVRSFAMPRIVNGGVGVDVGAVFGCGDRVGCCCCGAGGGSMTFRFVGWSMVDSCCRVLDALLTVERARCAQCDVLRPDCA